ncbi:hypothetical protein ACFVVM_10195 [Nocardia sp. NPDC058176]|uniref:hypothetical protein n=1 Tax=Nocardia sp. NPDC058176 TaxID=3346368 RepID=UPI0036DA979A
MIWLRRRGIQDWSRWMLPALGFGLLAVTSGLATGFATSTALADDPSELSSAAAAVVPVPLLVLGGAGLPLAAAVTAAFATRRMQRPLVADFGAIDQEVLLARVTDSALTGLARGGRTRRVDLTAMPDRVRLQHVDGNANSDLTADTVFYTEIASVHAITLTDEHRREPWFISTGGYAWYPTGDRAVRINTGRRETNLLIPTADAEIVAEILSVRVHRAKRSRRV